MKKKRGCSPKQTYVEHLIFTNMERTFNWQLVNEKSKSLVNTCLEHFENHQETGEGIPFFKNIIGSIGGKNNKILCIYILLESHPDLT